MSEENTDSTNILLAKVQPGKSLDPVNVKLEKVSLASEKDYSCISYISSGKTEEVSRDGQACSVDSVLVDALRAFRKSDAESFFWTEELTSDTSDTATAQKMAFLNAGKVQIWIGQGSSHNVKATELLEQFAGQWRLFKEALRLPDIWSQARPQQLTAMVQNVKQAITTGKMNFPELKDPAVVESMNELIGASYFRHVKAISSTMLAKSVIIMVGDAAISWEDYSDAFNLIAASGGLIPLKCDQVQFQLVMGLRVGTRRRRKDPRSIELLPMLQQSRQTECQDPRDRVFSLLPIISPSKRVEFGYGIPQVPIKVDYSASQQQVFADAARYIIGERQDLLLWNDVPSSMKPSRLPDLPSWVPDWSDTSNFPALKLRRSMALRSWESAPCVQQIRKPIEITTSGVLKVQAHIFSSITSISPKVYTESNFHNIALENLQMLPPTEVLQSKDDYWRCLVLDQELTEKVPPRWYSKLWISVAAKFAIFKVLGIEPAQVAEVFRLGAENPTPLLQHLFKLAGGVDSGALAPLLSQATGRRFFVTEGGFLGMGFHEQDGWDEDHRIRVGDVVAVFVGGYFPYILRECGRGGDGIVQYRLVGEAHVQGLMEAEALQIKGWMSSTWKDVVVESVEIV